MEKSKRKQSQIKLKRRRNVPFSFLFPFAEKRKKELGSVIRKEKRKEAKRQLMRKAMDIGNSVPVFFSFFIETHIFYEKKEKRNLKCRKKHQSF